MSIDSREAAFDERKLLSKFVSADPMYCPEREVGALGKRLKRPPAIDFTSSVGS